MPAKTKKLTEPNAPGGAHVGGKPGGSKPKHQTEREIGNALYETGRRALDDGLELLDSGRTEAAFRCFKKAEKPLCQALEVKHQDALAAIESLATAFRRVGKPAKAVTICNKQISDNPRHDRAYFALALAQLELGRSDQAIANLYRALTINPQQAEAYARLAWTLYSKGDLEKAIQAAGRAVALDPEDAQNHVDLAGYQLMAGHFGEGWDNLRWCHRLLDQPQPTPIADRPEWDGRPLNGKTLLVHSEPNFRDVLQLARYLPLLSRRGGKVIVQTPAILHRLLSASGLADQVVTPDTAVDCNCQTTLLDLPRLLGTRLETIPADVPYLQAPADSRQTWESRIAGGRGLRVGLAWADEDDVPAAHAKGVLEATHLRPLSEIPGVTLYSLQRGRPSEIRKVFGDKIVDSGLEESDFADRAAVIESLDLVISGDTAVAHLAGALAIPVWTLLPPTAHWRWLLDRTDSPWYPGMRLFRRKGRLGWAALVKQVCRELKKSADAVAQGTDKAGSSSGLTKEAKAKTATRLSH